MLHDRVTGSILGLALGDAFGAPHEGGPLERLVWRLIGRTNGKRRWTDDTQMSIDVMESLIARGRIDQDDLARRLAASYRWSRGYGRGAARLLEMVRRGRDWRRANTATFPNGSYGNGGAMRAPAVGLFHAFLEEDQIVRAADASAEVTHAHPLGREGAVLIALATALALRDTESTALLKRLEARATETYATRLRCAREWLETASTPEPRTVVAQLGNGIAATESVVTAIYMALRHREAGFEELVADVVRLGGDVDTIAAMAGAIWGAMRGHEALPASWLAQLERRAYLTELATQLAGAMPNSPR